MDRNASWTCGVLALLCLVGAQPAQVAATSNFQPRASDLDGALGSGARKSSPASAPGWFDASAPIVTPGHALDAAVGDLDGDGMPDLAAVCDGASQVSLWRGLGDGRFESLPSARGSAPLWQVLLEDFNGDGRADVVASQGDVYGPAGDVCVWRSTATGFARPDFYAQGHAGLLACADFDGDGRKDLAVAGHRQGASLAQVLHARPDGTFEPIGAADLGDWGGNGSELLAGDFDGDGAIDLALTSPGLCMSVAYGFGNGHFAAPVCNSTTFYQFELHAAGDLDLDGIDDIVFEELDPVAGRLYALYGRHDRTFDISSACFADLYDVHGVAIADINGNGEPDVVAVDQTTLDVVTGDGQRGFDPPRTTAIGDKDDGKPIVADLDLDGRPDVIVPRRFAQTIAVLLHR
jgi:hypothetical protein